MARARQVDVDCEAPFAVVAAQAVEVRAAEVLARSAGVLDRDDPERVHDMRVATRRLRAALEVFAPAFPRKRHRKALKRVKALADALGERRDPDVEIELLESLRGEVAEPDLDAFERLLAARRERQRRANERLAPLVAGKRLKKLRRRLERLAEAAR